MTLKPTLHNTLSSMNLPTKLSLEDFFNKVVKVTGYPFFEHDGQVYRVMDSSCPPTGVDYSALTVTEAAVLQYAVSLDDWESVNSLIYEMKSQVEDKLGTDYSNPRFDE